MDQKPSVGRVVHYVSHGTPTRPDGTQAFTQECRAAIITGVHHMYGDVMDTVDLCVLNPTGFFFNQKCERHETTDAGLDAGGTWHWPERV